MKKKLIGIGLSFILIFSALTGCAADNADGDRNTDTGNASQAAETQVEGNVPDGVVTVIGGQIQGTQANGVWSFLGIPYAEVNERFVPASEVTPWEGVRDADSYGKISYQGTVVGMKGSNGSNNDNNCQNLNI